MEGSASIWLPCMRSPPTAGSNTPRGRSARGLANIILRLVRPSSPLRNTWLCDTWRRDFWLRDIWRRDSWLRSQTQPRTSREKSIAIPVFSNVTPTGDIGAILRAQVQNRHARAHRSADRNGPQLQEHRAPTRSSSPLQITRTPASTSLLSREQSVSNRRVTINTGN